MPLSFAQALAEDIAADIAAITPPHPKRPNACELRAGITAGGTQVYYFERELRHRHVSAWQPHRPPTEKEDVRVRSLLKARKLKSREGPQGYILLALSSEN
jgi:hypothetical protein